MSSPSAVHMPSKPVARKEKKRVKIPFLLLFFVAFILTLVFLFFENKTAFSKAVECIFNYKRKAYIYDTYTVAFEDNVPEEFRNMVKENLGKMEFNKVKRFEFKERNADLLIGTEKKEDSEVVFSKDFIPVGHLYSLLTDLDEDTLKQKNLFMLDAQLKGYVESQYGVSITLLENMEKMTEKLKESDDNIGLVNFGDLNPTVKIIPFDGKYYLDDQDGGVKFRFYSTVKEEDRFIIPVISKNVDSSGVGSLSSDKLLKLNMSGVVAISRALGMKMNSLKDWDYPAQEIGPFLADADLTHVSNESSFVPGCVVFAGMQFCSRPEYLETLKASGVDIVELTGNHNNDYGAKHNADNMRMYTEMGWRYFGGGLNDEDASKILYEDVKGTKVAFIGYNYYDSMLGTGAIAGKDRAGANYYSEEKMKRNITEAKKNADVVIVTFQFQECYSYPDGDVIFPICYKPLSSPDQKGTFKKAVDYGANIVVGTQAHQPQTYELYNGGVIFYGLGNLYFDQSMWIGTRQGLILTHYFYGGKHIQTKVVPTYMSKDLIPRLATKEQGDLLLKLLKNAR